MKTLPKDYILYLASSELLQAMNRASNRDLLEKKKSLTEEQSLQVSREVLKLNKKFFEEMCKLQYESSKGLAQ